MVSSAPVTALKGVGEVRARQLRKLGIETLSDLISYFPRGYEDRTHIIPLAELESGEPACFQATVVSAPRTSYIRRGLNSTRCAISDQSAKIRVTWFNQPWMRENLKSGESYYFYGVLSGDDRNHQILNPVVERADTPPVATRCIIPVYSLTKGLTSKMLQHLIFSAMATEPPREILPKEFRKIWPSAAEVYQEIHHPTSMERLSVARSKLIFEEFFLYSMGLGLMKAQRKEKSAYPCRQFVPTSFYDALPFSLTHAQERALQEISEDLCSGKPMNRLVQGDVGSGKTMVALGAMLQAVENGYQTALMAPTELLAMQHYQTMSNFLKPLGVSCVLLTGSVTTAQRRKALNEIATGATRVVIGTHALFSDAVDFCNLGLAVIDEQQRFGVRQRAALTAKGCAPHLLVLSATPIPRTLSLILYGDLDVSLIDELPPGRKPINTFLVSSNYRARLLGFLKKQAAEGRQSYVVCPAVEENPDTGLTAAETEFEKLRAALPELSIGLVHGKLHSEARDAAMSAFLRGETDILVATTVIEVGVDVKNATLMIIEDADRFGLSQLHQLRGRVGRGGGTSYCVLVSDNKNKETRKRLKTLCSTNDGFAIAQQDLELRGPGDFFGDRQSGLPMFHMASLSTDLGILKDAQEAATRYLSEPDLCEPEEYSMLMQRVDALFSVSGDTFN